MQDPNCNPTMRVNGHHAVRESDFVTEMLRASPLSIRFVGRFHLTGPCGVDLPDGLGMICRVTRSEPRLALGRCEEPTPAEEGDVFVLSPGARQRARNSPSGPFLSGEGLLDLLRHPLGQISLPGGGTPTATLTGGLFGFDSVGVCPLLWMLPPVIRLRRRELEDAAAVDSLAGLIEHELSHDQLGRQGILHRLLEILFIRAVRSKLVDAAPARDGLLHGLLHRDLATTLAMIHREPEKPWTVAALADRAVMSRSNFSATFLKVLGKPPLQYLRDYRMQVACRLLRSPSLGLKEIASRVGYDSTSAFSAAFKRVTGIHPSGYRRHEAAHESILDEADEVDSHGLVDANRGTIPD